MSNKQKKEIAHSKNTQEKTSHFTLNNNAKKEFEPYVKDQLERIKNKNK